MYDPIFLIQSGGEENTPALSYDIANLHRLLGGWDANKYFNLVKENGAIPATYLYFKDTQSARNFLEKALSDDCKEAIADLISKLEEITGERAITYDLLASFDDITKNQKKGGVFFNFRTFKDLDNAVSKGWKAVYGFEPKLSKYSCTSHDLI